MPFSIVRSDPLFNPEAFADTLAHAEPEWRARILETLNANAWIYARNGCPDSDVRDSLAFLLRLRREFHELFSHLAPYMWHEQTTGALDIAAIEAGDVRAGYMDGRIVGTEVETPPLPDGYAALVARYFSDDEKIRAEWTALRCALSAADRITLRVLTESLPPENRGTANLSTRAHLRMERALAGRG